jgi:2-polyprenyl-3-methyl-5-hydroxy-6-metoxy-1,4-benzoquinol methylase
MVDLGMSPLCQNQIKPSELAHMEPFFPLRVYVCDQCFLVQLEEFVAPEHIFANEYAYFSSYSSSWVAHAKNYVEMMIQRFGFGPEHLVMEIASNDGYLLQHFVHQNIPCLGIEPAANCAEAAKEKGVDSITEFFGTATSNKVAQNYGKPNLLLGNNVLAHVPDINDFVSGMKQLLNDSGVITMEFPHLYQLMKHNQFDTIYHEHFSYLSFYTVETIFAHYGLTIFDVEEITTHGGSIRIFARHAENDTHPITERAKELRQREIDEGFTQLDAYGVFEENVKETKRSILKFLIEAKSAGKSIVGYGAPGKGNTLLNYCGIRTDFLDYTVDRSPHKAGTYTPGTHIPIFYPEKIKETQPDYVFILPWNLKKEIIDSMSFIREWGGKFVVPIPTIDIIE